MHWKHDFPIQNPTSKSKVFSNFWCFKEMENQTKQTHLLIFAISCFLCLSLLPRTVKGDGNFSYDPCSERGPKHWGELKEEWAKCKIGKIQSPISLSRWTADFNPSLVDLKRKHRPANAILENDDHEILVSTKLWFFFSLVNRFLKHIVFLFLNEVRIAKVISKLFFLLMKESLISVI